ncbi:DUF1513 domain-containing protein [Shimia aestuarii]|uniref:DUF1513 domain-containing protein n=1 Tax=Shimia aestuarii TaxID=254406 RepID=UPI001FB41E96|nr:DUF1513 domain-containing protein [Shimia aestuarii]
MVTRRGFIAGALAAGSVSTVTWAGLGDVHFLSAAQDREGAYRLIGMAETGAAIFSVPLPARGHAAAAHPSAAEAVGFARRPGNFAFVVDCLSGAVLHRLEAPEGRHFYGHGAFSMDGNTLFTTENDFEAGQGVIGVWDRSAGYRRIGEFASGGVGPHQICRLPGRETLVVANGGIETHPDAGRAKLNIPMMEPNLAYLSPEGAEIEVMELPREMHMNSIRHIAVRDDGMVAFGMQWQGDRAQAPVLFGAHRLGEEVRLLQPTPEQHAALNAYVGSVTFSQDGREVAISSPRGGVVQVIDLEGMRVARSVAMADVCGIGANAAGFVLTSGDGRVARYVGDRLEETGRQDIRWDNHMVAV